MYDTSDIYAEAGPMLHDYMYPIRPESRLVLVYEDGTVSWLSISRMNAANTAEYLIHTRQVRKADTTLHPSLALLIILVAAVLDAFLQADCRCDIAACCIPRPISYRYTLHA